MVFEWEGERRIHLRTEEEKQGIPVKVEGRVLSKCITEQTCVFWQLVLSKTSIECHKSEIPDVW